MAAPSEAYDLMIVADATSSMGSFLQSLNSSLQDIIRISATTACFSRIGVMAYRDYDRGMSKVTQWSGWHGRYAKSDISQEQLLSFVRTLKPEAGGDWPEATRSGLAHAYELMRPEAKTIILLYADAPPHTEHTEGLWKAEQDALLKPDSYGGTGELFADWVSAARTLSDGEKRAQVFCIVEPGMYLTAESNSMFTYLSTITGGVCLAFPSKPSPAIISKITVALLMAWMGADKQGAKADTAIVATQLQFADASGIGQVASERDQAGVLYLPVSRAKEDRTTLRENFGHSPISLEMLSKIIPRREHPVMDFARRYKADPEYRDIVVEQLAEIIESDVSAIALNPVFGTLWRTVCNDRLNPARDGLITRFGLQVDKMQDAEKKDRLKSWLEESYDWAGEILHMIQSVPQEGRYPCVFLDPTVRFSQTVENEDKEDENSMEFNRDELLEIGRSCDYRILRRLGRILTRLTYVNSKEDLPAHIRDVKEEEIPRIPMALAEPARDRKFWKVLLHAVLPGTMLAARPAALLAALSVRMGIKPLEKAAYTELMAWRDNWNTLDIPETWNSNCLSLLLEADKKHREAMAGTQSTNAETILKPEDRKLFETLVDYKLLELNMDTTLTAEVGWTPNKSKVPIGPVVVCKKCRFPRSVTIMGEKGVCGMCATPCHCESKEAHDAVIAANVSKEDTDKKLATWVECSMTYCRAQYVVYHVGKLNVRPKCHYCRQKMLIPKTDRNYDKLTTSPCVTCTRCSNRILWPEAYRPAVFNSSTYTCPACAAHPTITTITPTSTTARALAAENGTAWLLRNDSNTLPTPLTNRSLFHTLTTATCAATPTLLPSLVSILPTLTPNPTTPHPPLTLTLHNKQIHNTPALLTSLASWITARRVQRGTCTLCFRDLPKQHLHLACGGRRGCRQTICGGCADAWYGLNAPGRVINVAALSCPFCRRQPTGRVKLPGGLRFLEGLRDAVEEGGRGWVYGWCAGRCGAVRRVGERVCGGGGGAGVGEGEGWICEGCVAVVGPDAVNGRELVVKMCPRCGVATEKESGCDHIECPCGAHWCFACGEKESDSEREIYAHMTAVHRTWYGAGGPDEGDYEDGDYEMEW